MVDTRNKGGWGSINGGALFGRSKRKTRGFFFFFSVNSINLFQRAQIANNSKEKKQGQGQQHLRRVTPFLLMDKQWLHSLWLLLGFSRQGVSKGLPWSLPRLHRAMNSLCSCRELLKWHSKSRAPCTGRSRNETKEVTPCTMRVTNQPYDIASTLSSPIHRA